MTTTITPRVIHELTPEEAERFNQLADLVDAEKPDIIRRARLTIAAGDEPGFSGDLRRAIHSGGVKLEKLAEAAQIHVFSLCDFLEGTADLTSTQIAAIVQLLGVLLVRPFPIDAPRKPRP
ncbi:MAG: hypothetical protein SH850_12260 [Planctomycetaceae bacterium]|nr:hypothetical protein [Planctomycetaceae bacterium]